MGLDRIGAMEGRAGWGMPGAARRNSRRGGNHLEWTRAAGLVRGPVEAGLAARGAGGSPNNQLQAVRLTRLDNVTVELAGQPPLTAPTTVALDSHPAQLALTVRRVI